VRILLLGHAPSVHTQRWARALAGRGHEIRLLSVVPAPGAPYPGEPVGNPGAALPFLRYASARGAVRAALASWKPDVTVAHFLPNYGFLGALAGARPLFLVAWGSDLLVNARRTPFHAARARWVLERADLIHVDAENLAEAARSLGAATPRVWARPWGVDTSALAASEPWTERLRRAGTLRILWTRMLDPLYDPASFLAALASLRRRGVSFHAVVAGEGPLRPSLEEAAAREGIAGAVRFAGHVNEAALRALLRENEIYVSMSRSDSTSQSLLEAMAAGLYPVVSDIAGNRPWVGSRDRSASRYAERGLLVPPGDSAALADALQSVASDPDAGARVARGAALVRAEADWNETVALTEARLVTLARAAEARA
jgi:glycosyltransferase involved in cell wall biosynthesis